MVPSKLSVSVLPIAAWRTTTWITVLPKQALTVSLASRGELLLGLPYLRNRRPRRKPSTLANYYLDYRTSETNRMWAVAIRGVNYYLGYRTSETRAYTSLKDKAVNYYLDYRTSETDCQSTAPASR